MEVSRHPLPTELELYIFEMLVVNSLDAATRLLLVSKYVYDWILPVMYHTIDLKDEHTSILIGQTRVDLLSRHVHAVAARSFDNWTRWLLSRCPNITSVLIRDLADARTAAGWNASCKAPSQVAFYNSGRTYPNMFDPSVRNITQSITHLRMAWLDSGLLVVCPKVTHIAFDWSLTSELAEMNIVRLLVENSKLKVLAICIRPAPWSSLDAAGLSFSSKDFPNDPRIVFRLTMSSFDDEWLDEKKNLRGELWRKSEARVVCQRNTGVHPSSDISFEMGTFMSNH